MLHPVGQGWWEEVFISLLQVSASASPSGRRALSLLQHGVLPTGDRPPQTSPAWSFPRAAVLHKQLQRGSLPQPSFRHKHSSLGGVPQGQKPCQQTCSYVGSSLYGSTDLSRSVFQHGLSLRPQPSSDIHLL